jgi:hypothetical protein
VRGQKIQNSQPNNTENKIKIKRDVTKMPYRSYPDNYRVKSHVKFFRDLEVYQKQCIFEKISYWAYSARTAAIIA